MQDNIFPILPMLYSLEITDPQHLPGISRVSLLEMGGFQDWTNIQLISDMLMKRNCLPPIQRNLKPWKLNKLNVTKLFRMAAKIKSMLQFVKRSFRKFSTKLQQAKESNACATTCMISASKISILAVEWPGHRTLNT